VDLRHLRGFSRRGGFRIIGVGRGHLDVRGIVACAARHDRVFAGLDEHLELGTRRPAHRPGVSRNETISEPKCVEDPHVALAHFLVRAPCTVFVHVERVGVLHQELAATQEATSRSRLVAELRLDLVQVLRKIAIATDLVTRNVRHDLFVGRAEVIVAAFPVFQAEKRVAEAIPAPGLLEVVGRQEGRHEHLQRASTIHLAPDDGLDLLQDPHAERQEVVQAGANPAHEPRARE
jgi:hypothetical protein